MLEDGIKKRLHNANTLSIARLISPILRSFNVYNVLKLNTHEQVNIVRNMHKIVSKQFFKNNQENIVTSANEIQIKFV